MLLKFSVVRTVGADCTLGVCGSLPEIGDWNPANAAALTASATPSNSEPSFWEGSVQLENKPQSFDYKFVCRWKSGLVEWEGCGAVHNRHCTLDEKDAIVAKDQYWLPTARWVEVDGVTNEFQHTTAFYFKVICDHNGIHFSKITDSVWLGSCPRQFYHVAMLKSIGVTAVMTLQTASDLTHNCIGVFPPSRHYEEPLCDHLAALYRDQGIVFIFYPTEDMSTAGRVRMVPQGVFLLQGLLANGHKVYVHCNAGVGRSTAIVCAYLSYVQGAPLREAEYLVASKRPAVFIDRKAMQSAARDFQAKFGDISTMMQEKCNS